MGSSLNVAVNREKAPKMKTGVVDNPVAKRRQLLWQIKRGTRIRPMIAPIALARTRQQGRPFAPSFSQEYS